MDNGGKNQSICFVAPNAFPVLVGDQTIPIVGGAELQQVLIAKGLASRGYRVSMMCLDFGQQDEIEVEGVKVYRAYKRAAGIPVLRFIWPRVTSIWRCLRKANAEIYYQRSASMQTGLVSLFCQLNNKKAIFAGAVDSNFVRNTNRIRYGRDRRIYEYGVRNVDLIIVQNAEQQRLCAETFGRKSTLIPSCYELAERRDKSLATEILWVATIKAFKRPQLFLDIVEQLPHLKFKMIGGPGSVVADKNLYQEVRDRAKTLENLDFLGFVPLPQIGLHFDKAALFVNTSDSEGFPNTFLQAWAREVPTLSFIDCGARLESHPVGKITDSIEEMTRTIEDWMSNEEKRHAEGQRSRAYVELNHSIDMVLDCYEKVINGLLHSKRGK